MKLSFLPPSSAEVKTLQSNTATRPAWLHDVNADIFGFLHFLPKVEESKLTLDNFLYT